MAVFCSAGRPATIRAAMYFGAHSRTAFAAAVASFPPRRYVTRTSSLPGVTATTVASASIRSLYRASSTCTSRCVMHPSPPGIAAIHHVLQASERYKSRAVLRVRSPIRKSVAIPPRLQLGRISLREIRKGLRVEFRGALAQIDFHGLIAEFPEARGHFSRVRQLREPGLPRVRDERSVHDRGIRIVHQRQFQPDFVRQLVAFVASIRERRAGRKRLPVVLLLVRVAAKVRLFLEQQPVLPAKEIRRRKPR